MPIPPIPKFYSIPMDRWIFGGAVLSKIFYRLFGLLFLADSLTNEVQISDATTENATLTADVTIPDDFGNTISFGDGLYGNILTIIVEEFANFIIAGLQCNFIHEFGRASCILYQYNVLDDSYYPTLEIRHWDRIMALVHLFWPTKYSNRKIVELKRNLKKAKKEKKALLLDLYKHLFDRVFELQLEFDRIMPPPILDDD